MADQARDELLRKIDRVIDRLRTSPNEGSYAFAREFIRQVAGQKSSFYERMGDLTAWMSDARYETALEIVEAYRAYVSDGLDGTISLERRAQLDTVSDFLAQAQRLLDDRTVHPAAAVFLTGAVVEEFLRAWAQIAGLTIGNARPGIDAYAKTLRGADLVTVQDHKDITSWAGLRNHAAHGEWDKVADPQRARLMLEGVNLFMRQHSV